MRTEVQDRRTGLCFTQVCVGSMSDSARPCPWLLSAGAIGDRISYTHSPLLIPPAKGLGNPLTVTAVDGYSDGQEDGTALAGGGDGQGHEKDDENYRRGGERGGGSININSSDDVLHSSFALVTALSEPLEASVCAELVRPRGARTPSPPPYAQTRTNVSGRPLLGEKTSSTEGYRTQPSDVAAVILGPVVGRVDVVKQANGMRESCRVAVVVEVDRDSAVTCVVRKQRQLREKTNPFHRKRRSKKQKTKKQMIEPQPRF